MPPGGRRGSTAVMLKPRDEVVLEGLVCRELDAVREPDAPVVAAALSSVDELSVDESVELGASVIVPLAGSGSVEDGVSDADGSGDAEVLEGISEDTTSQRCGHNDQYLMHVLLEDLVCRLMIMPSISLNESGQGHAAA
jgi:hypothetical protein